MKKKVKIKYFIIPFIVITVAYCFLLYGIISKWIETNHELIRKDSYNVARVYSLNLQKSEKAKKLLYDLIDERLLLASKTMKSEGITPSNEILADWAKELNVEVIYAYDNQGVIEFDSSEEFIGWRAPEGHPARLFMESGEMIRVEEFKKNSENDDYYKYGYARLNDGRFYQIGVSAKKTDVFLEQFEIKELLQKIGSTKSMAFAHLIDGNHTIVESTDHEKIGTSLTDKKLMHAISLNQEYDQMAKYDETSVYEVYVPVFVDNFKIGTLVIGQEADIFTSNIVGLISNGLLILLSILVVMGYFMVTIYNKSGDHLKLAYYDNLTKLPNDAYMKEYIGSKIILNKS